MEFSVMSRMRIEKYSRQAHRETSAVISIYSLDRYPAKIARIPENRIKDILYVAFDDVENGPGAITEEDAKKIIQFTDKVVNRRYERLIVQCDAGISRSSGICAAIEKYLGYDDGNIFNSPDYFPNRKCYRTVLEYAMKQKAP